MTFISSIIVLNVSIILMMIVAFSNITFVHQIQSLKLYQLVSSDDIDYEKYLSQPKEKHEIKLSTRGYFRSVHNLNFIKFKLSDEKTWEDRLNNIKNSCGFHKAEDFAVRKYYIETFGKKIKNFKECTESISGNINILGTLNDALNAKEPEKQAPSGCCPCIMEELEKKIKVIDLKLNESVTCINKFYQCLHIFKNSVFDMKIEGANYPIKAIPQIDIDEKKKLSTSEKKKILTLKDIDFLRYKEFPVHAIKYNVPFVQVNVYAKLLEVYTGYEYVFPLLNSGPDDCNGLLINNDKTANKMIFEMTQLSYKYIYPSQSEDWRTYISKREIIIKILKLLDNRHTQKDTRNEMITTLENENIKGDEYYYDLMINYYRYQKDDEIKKMITTLEKENLKVDQKYYNLMKNCRALSEEKDYEVYAKRLINTGCRPLGEPEWKVEVQDTEKDNKVAKFQALHTK